MTMLIGKDLSSDYLDVKARQVTASTSRGYWDHSFIQPNVDPLG